MNTKDWRYDPQRMYSREKQRQSRIIWRDLVPDNIAEQQEGWERRHAVLALYERTGLAMKWIGVLYDVSGDRIRQMIERAKGDRQRNATSPAEKYLNQRERPDNHDIAWKKGSQWYREHYSFGRAHKLLIAVDPIAGDQAWSKQ